MLSSTKLVMSWITFVAVSVVFLHDTTSGSPIETSSQHDDILGKITDVRGEIEDIYKRLNTLTGTNKDDSQVESYHNNADRLCLTQECIAASHKLFQNMNSSVAPCDDFYQFSCGNYIHQTVIPDDKGMMSASFSPLRNKIEILGRQLLEEQDSSETFEVDRMSKRWYNACMNETYIEQLGLDPLLDSLRNLGGWPVLGEDDESKYESFRWYEQTTKLNIEGFSIDTIMSHSISSDDKNILYRVIRFDQPSLGMRREYLVKGFEDKYVQHYYQYMVESAVLLGSDEERAKEQLKESLLFEIALANISAPREERRDQTKLYNPTTLDALDKDAGAEDSSCRPPSWHKYIARIVNDTVRPIEEYGQKQSNEITINSDEKIIIRNPVFFKNFIKLISATKPNIVANYMAWRVVKSRMEYLNKDAQEIVQTYDKAIKGVGVIKARWKKCVESTGFNAKKIQSGAGAASSMYVRRHFKPEDKQVMLNMIGYLRKYFTGMLEDLSWMDEATKVEAKAKLDKMDQMIAYPDELIDQNIIDELHIGLETSDNFYNNILQRSKFWNAFEYNRLKEKIDPNDWKEHQAVALVNAFYNPETNSMEFPAGILQGSFFNSKNPKYMNYGTIGIVIGHEITHGFDDQGRQRNSLGILKDWWANSTSEEYVKRAKCMVEKYGNFTSKQVDMQINGINSQGENIADNGGVVESYGAYLNWVEEQKRLYQDKKWEEQILPGHDFTPKQLFWVSYGQLWCQKFRDDALRNTIKTGVHTPGEFRITGPLSNSDEFAKDFKCPKGSPMNPEKKCKVW